MLISVTLDTRTISPGESETFEASNELSGVHKGFLWNMSENNKPLDERK